MKGWTMLSGPVQRDAGKSWAFVVRRAVLAGLAGLCVICWGQEKAGPPARRVPRASALKTVQLPEPRSTGAVSFEQALAKQQAVLAPTNQRLKFAEIGQLAWAGQGVTRPPTIVGTTPPTDEVYPVKLYFVIPDGTYLYNPNDHTLQQTASGDVREALAAAVLGQNASAAGCEIVIAGSARGLAARYGNDARSAMLLQAGQMAQNMLLQAVSLELGFVAVNRFDANSVRRVCRLSRSLEPLYVVFAGYPAGKEQAVTDQSQAGAVTKKALLIVARQGFRDEELFETKRILELAGVQTVTTSTRTGTLMGMLGGVAQASLLLHQVKVDDFDAIVFIGGTGAVEYFNSPAALNIAREAAAKSKVLAAISIAPSVLANAGVLTGTRATSFISERGRLLQSGAIYTGVPVERDGFTITATDPLAVPLFARAILDALAGR